MIKLSYFLNREIEARLYDERKLNLISNINSRIKPGYFEFYLAKRVFSTSERR